MVSILRVLRGSPLILTGQTTIVELHSDLESDWQRGIRRARRVRGLRDDLEGMVPFVHAPGVQWFIENEEPPFARLTVRFNDPDTSATTLRLTVRGQKFPPARLP